VGLLTVLPVGQPPEVTRRRAGRAMLLAPLVCLGLGGLAAGVMWSAERLGLSGLLAAVLAIALLAVATRGLHLDGLADTADGIGARLPAEDALRVMRGGDIGPFGVVTLVLVLAVQVSALAQSRPEVLLVAVPAGRLAITWASRRGVPAARRDGLGAIVAGSVRVVPLLLATAVVVTASALLGWRGPVAVLAGVAASIALVGHARRRLGGVTGDVLGACTETATTVALVVLATA
jgi:adenosylcobinamide-GDP ribazoletransferase